MKRHKKELILAAVVGYTFNLHFIRRTARFWCSNVLIWPTET